MPPPLQERAGADFKVHASFRLLVLHCWRPWGGGLAIRLSPVPPPSPSFGSSWLPSITNRVYSQVWTREKLFIFDARHGVKKRCQTWHRIINAIGLLDAILGIVFWRHVWRQKWTIFFGFTLANILYNWFSHRNSTMMWGKLRKNTIS